MVDNSMKALDKDFDRMYSTEGRPGIPPERLLRALLLQALYSVRSERQLVVATEVTTATGTSEAEATPRLLKRRGATGPGTVGGDKAYDRGVLVDAVRELGMTPHVAQCITKHRGSMIDGRTTRHEGYAISQRRPKMVEEAFGWAKTIGGLRKTRHRGTRLVDWIFQFTMAAYNLVRMRNLMTVQG